MHEMRRLPDLQRNAAKAWADMDDVGTPTPCKSACVIHSTKAWADMDDVCTPTPWADYPVDFKLYPDTPTPMAAQALPLPLPMLHQLPTPEVNNSFVVQAPQLWQHDCNDWNNAAVGPSYTSGVEWPNFGIPQNALAPEQPQPVQQWQNIVEDVAVAAEGEVVQHGAGLCRPCAWYWRASGCRNGSACSYCHLCPEGELKSRKKTKIAAMKMGALIPVSKKPSSTATGGCLKLDSLLVDKP